MHLARRVSSSLQSPSPNPVRPPGTVSRIQCLGHSRLFNAGFPQSITSVSSLPPSKGPVRYTESASLQCISPYLHTPIDLRLLGDTTTTNTMVRLQCLCTFDAHQQDIDDIASSVGFQSFFILHYRVGRTSLGHIVSLTSPRHDRFAEYPRLPSWTNDRNSSWPHCFPSVCFETGPRPPIQSYNGLAINHRRSPARSGSSLVLCSIDRFDETIFPRDRDHPDFIPTNLSPWHGRRHHGNRPNPRRPAALLWYMSVVIMEQRPPACVYAWATSSFWGISFGVAFRLHCHFWPPPLFLCRWTCHHHSCPRQSTHGTQPRRNSRHQPNPRSKMASAAAYSRGVSGSRCTWPRTGTSLRLSSTSITNPDGKLSPPDASACAPET